MTDQIDAPEITKTLMSRLDLLVSVTALSAGVSLVTILHIVLQYATYALASFNPENRQNVALLLRSLASYVEGSISADAHGDEQHRLMKLIANDPDVTLRKVYPDGPPLH